MSTPTGAVSPYPGAVPGEVISPSASAVITPKAAAAHAVSRVLSDLVRNSRAYHNEADVLSALNAVDSFRRAFTDGHAEQLRDENEPAQVEDVSKRKPPAGAAPAPVAGPAIDYAALARAIVAVQQEQAAVVQQ